MNDRQHIRAKYADLLRDSEDPETLRLLAQIDGLAQPDRRPVALHARIWGALDEAAKERAAGSTHDYGWGFQSRVGARVSAGRRLSGKPPRAGRVARTGYVTAYALAVMVVAIGLIVALSRSGTAPTTSNGSRKPASVPIATEQGTASLPAATSEAFLPRETVGRFLDLRLFSINAESVERTRRYERLARSYLTPQYSSQVRELAAMDIPILSDEEGRAKLDGTGLAPPNIRGTTASALVGWRSGAEVLVRQFTFELVAGEWRISGIERVGGGGLSAPQFDALGTPVPPLPSAPQGLPALQLAFEQAPRLRPIVDQNLGEQVEVSRKIGDFTITAHRVYADAEHVVIALATTGPADRSFGAIELGQEKDAVTLTDGQGRRLATARGASGFNSASVRVFHTPASAPGDRLNLRLTIAGLEVREATQGDYRTIERYPDPCNEQSEPVRCYTVAGPIHFALPVPVRREVLRLR